MQLTSRDLLLMLLPTDEIQYEDVAVTPGSGSFSNIEAALHSFDPDDTGRDLRERGRIRGVAAVYFPTGDEPVIHPALHSIMLSVQQFRSSDAALNWIDDERAMLHDLSGGEVAPYVRIEDVSDIFVTGVVDGEIDGVTYEYQTAGEDYYVTTASFAHDELVGTATIVRSDGFDVGIETGALADLLSSRMIGVLDGSITGESIDIPSPEEFAAAHGEGGVLGLRCSYASKFLRERYDLPDGEGCVVLRVDGNSGAERAGLRIGDKIVELDGRRITSGRQFTYEFEDRGGGDSRRIFVIEREDERLTIDVKLGTRADPPDDDPYHDYLLARGNADTAEAIRFYTRALESDPEFDLAYLYRGEERRFFTDDADPVVPGQGEDDMLRAIALDPALAEAHESYALLVAQDWHEFDAALDHIGHAIEIIGCGTQLADWQYECGQFLVSRAEIYALRNGPGDLDRAQADLDAAEPVEGMATRRAEIALSVRYAADEIADHTCIRHAVVVPCKLRRDFTYLGIDDAAAEEARVRQAIAVGTVDPEAHYRLATFIAGRGGSIDEVIAEVELAYSAGGCGPGGTYEHCPKYILARAQAYMARANPGDLERAYTGFLTLSGGATFGPDADWALRRIEQLGAGPRRASLRAAAAARASGYCLYGAGGIPVPCAFLDGSETRAPEDLAQAEASTRFIIMQNSEEALQEAHYVLAQVIALQGGRLDEVLVELQHALEDAPCDVRFDAAQCGKYIFARAQTYVVRAAPGDRERAIADYALLAQYVQWQDAAQSELRRLEALSAAAPAP